MGSAIKSENRDRENEKRVEKLRARRTKQSYDSILVLGLSSY